MSFQTHEHNGLVWLTSSLLSGIPHGFSTRRGGVSPAPWDSLNLRPGCGDAQEHLEENYRRFCGAVGADVTRAVLSRQVHETAVRPCGDRDAGMGLTRDRDFESADALVTGTADLPLVVFSADCGTILLYDPVRRAAGAVHAGWRGCAGGIVERAVREMTRLYGTDPADLRAALGPCIGKCCFETDGDVPAAMRAALGAAAEPFLDLAGLNRQWLLRAGLSPERIDVCELCTSCRPDLFWSHRKLGEARGVQAALIALPGEGRP